MAVRDQLTYSGGVLVEHERWSNGLGAGDPAAGYYTLDPVTLAVLTTRPLTAQETADLANLTQLNNRATFQAKAQAALTANQNDVTQDATIISGAATITGTPGTFTLAQCTTFIKQLAQAASILAGNDQNAKKELQALIYMALEQFDTTTGT